MGIIKIGVDLLKHSIIECFLTNQDTMKGDRMNTLQTFEIKKRFTNVVIFSGEYESFKDCVEKASASSISLWIFSIMINLNNGQI